MWFAAAALYGLVDGCAVDFAEVLGLSCLALSCFTGSLHRLRLAASRISAALGCGLGMHRVGRAISS